MRAKILIAKIMLEAAVHGAGHAHVPLTHHPGAVAPRSEELGERLVASKEVPRVRLTGIRRWLRADEITNARLVRMEASQQRRARRTTPRGVIRFFETHPARSQAIDVGRRDFTAVATEVRIAEVIDEDDEDVRRATGGSGPGRDERKAKDE